MKGLFTICPQIILISILKLKHLFHFLQTDFLYMLQITSSQVFGGSEVCSCTYARRIWLEWSWDLGTAVSEMLRFRFVIRTVLITHPCFICCQAVLSQSQGLLFLPLPPSPIPLRLEPVGFQDVLFLEYSTCFLGCSDQHTHFISCKPMTQPAAFVTIVVKLFSLCKKVNTACNHLPYLLNRNEGILFSFTHQRAKKPRTKNILSNNELARMSLAITI